MFIGGEKNASNEKVLGENETRFMATSFFP
jgi:hypothetical protein